MAESAPSEPSEEPLDLCIVGAGLAGTVAALRAHELGLRFVLIEANRPLHRQPSAADGGEIAGAETVVLEGGSSGGSWIADARLAAGSRAGIEAWVAELERREIPIAAQTRVFAIEHEPVEATGAGEAPAEAGAPVFRVRMSEPTHARERRVRARNVIVATGAPQPEPAESESDLPRAKRTEPLQLEAPVLVIGRTPRALERVLDLARAKVEAADAHAVYWSLGFSDDAAPDAPPEFEAGLGDRLLATCLTHDNIRVLGALSSLREQTAVDGTTRVLVTSRSMGRDGDSAAHPPIEFDPRCVVRADVEPPAAEASQAGTERGGWALLAGLPIQVERRDQASVPVVDRFGRLSVPGLYVAGDVCGATRLVRDTFDEPTDVGGHTREERDASVEGAAREAIRAVESIAGAPASDEPEETAQAGEAPVAWQLVAIEADGSLGATTPVESDVFEIGRRGRDLAEPDDEHMADHHASLVREEGEYFVADSGRGTGVWIRIDDEEGHLLEDEDQVWLGSQIIVASREGGAWTLVHYGADGKARETHSVGRGELTLGRDADVDLARDDALLSRRHARFSVEGEFLRVRDCGARNGTFVKVTGAHPLGPGSEFRIATRGYRFEARR